MHHKQYSNLKLNSGLTVPSEDFISIVESFSQIISNNLNLYSSGLVTRKIAQLCSNELCNHPNLTCGHEHCDKKIEKITKLLIKVKVHFAVKLANQALRQPRRNKKLLKLTHQ